MWQVNKTEIMLFSLLSAFFVLIAGSGISAAAEIIVHDGESIQFAVDNATSGDTIILEPGVYNESVTIQSPITILSESGNPEDTIIQGSGFSIYAGNVIIKGLTLKGDDESTGIFLSDSSISCTIENNRILNYDTGISTSIYCSGTTVNENKISYCGKGVEIGESWDNVISNNDILNCDSGIIINDLASAEISDNVITENKVGVSIEGDSKTSIKGNRIIFNSKCGLYDNAYGSNTIFNNFFNNTNNVIFDEFHQVPNIWNSTISKDKNIIDGPYIAGNYWATPNSTGFSQLNKDIDADGIAEEPCIIDGEDLDYMPLVTPEKQSGSLLPVATFQTNISKGSAPLSVQFTDLSKNASSWSWDFENDGIIDSTGKNAVHVYTVPGVYVVNHTASNEVGKVSKLTKINVTQAIISNQESNGTVEDGNTENNTNTSNNITGENGESNSQNGTNLNTENTTANNGTANVDNDSSEDNLNSDNSVSTGSSGKSSGSSGGSGGAGGSPEPAKNVEVKELSQAFITSGKTAQFDFTKNATCVVYVKFDAKKTFGKTTTIVEMLKGKSALVSELPSGEVYKSFNIWVGNGGIASSENIENSVICFKVEKTWLQSKNVDSDEISLNRYNNDKWEEIQVNKSGEDENYLYFAASISGYSSFVITGSTTGSITDKAKSYLEQETSEQENELLSGSSVKLTSETGDNAVKDENGASIPGFEIVFGVFSLLVVFLCRREL